MKNFLISTLLIAAIGFPLQLFFPWWSIAILAALLGFVLKFENSLWSYMAGFLGVALLWGIYAMYLDMGNAHILSTKMGNLFGKLSSSSMILLTALIGGIVGGFAAATGTLGKKLLH